MIVLTYNNTWVSCLFPVSVCDGATCNNGAECVPFNTTAYECNCTSAYSGPQCDGNYTVSYVVL